MKYNTKYLIKCYEAPAERANRVREDLGARIMSDKKRINDESERIVLTN